MLEPLGWDQSLERTALGGVFTPWRPELGLTISLSRTRGACVCAVGRGCRVGVDIESIDESVDALGVSQMQFDARSAALVATASPTERTPLFFKLWTLNEAGLKALGVGFAKSVLLAVDLEPPKISGGAPKALSWKAYLPATVPGLSLALAVLTHSEFEPQLHLQKFEL
jgi:4'-phosphopantetheinyl transferase